jgi:hypothetical protein
VWLQFDLARCRRPEGRVREDGVSLMRIRRLTDPFFPLKTSDSLVVIRRQMKRVGTTVRREVLFFPPNFYFSLHLDH